MLNNKSRFPEAFNLDNDIRKYHFVSQAEVTVPVINDEEEMRVTDVSEREDTSNLF